MQGLSTEVQKSNFRQHGQMKSRGGKVREEKRRDETTRRREETERRGEERRGEERRGEERRGEGRGGEGAGEKGREGKGEVAIPVLREPWICTRTLVVSSAASYTFLLRYASKS